MYKPLPDSVTIKESLIQGLGIFATERIPDNTLIGRIHVPNEKEKIVILELLLVVSVIILMILIVQNW